MSPAEIQKAYYTRTASSYDSLHNSEGNAEHDLALSFMCSLAGQLGLNSFLEVGAGTGRGISFLQDRGIKDVRGIEPVPALIEQAENRGLTKGVIQEGSGYSLPFPDNSFDAVFECAVLHHVAEPSRVVGEMTRVARKAVFISDANRFGQGSYFARLVKLGLYKTHLWNAARWIQTGRKMYSISDTDGLFYSYSVYDSYEQVARWADLIYFLPTKPNRGASLSWTHPLLTSEHVLLCGIKGDLGR